MFSWGTPKSAIGNLTHQELAELKMLTPKGPNP